MSAQAPPANLLAALLGPSTHVTRRVSIFSPDDLDNPWAEDVPLVDGSISVSQARDERRTLQLTIDNDNGALRHAIGNLWYDKIVKVYRGIEWKGMSWETQLGEFMIDDIDSQSFPGTLAIDGRDYTKKLLTSKFSRPTTFSEGTAVESVIRTIATNGGIHKFILPITGKELTRDFPFDRGTFRWKSMSDIATAYGYELYFDNQGYLVMREYQDPVSTPEVFTFSTGAMGTLVKYDSKSSDTRIYNHIAVTGQAADQLPVYAEARNTMPGSPTNVDEIGERTYEIVSSFIGTQDQAQNVADKHLGLHALEQYELTMESLVIAWLEAGEIVRFDDPDPSPGDPDRFLLSEFTIPVKLGTMTSTAKRVTMVHA